MPKVNPYLADQEKIDTDGESIRHWIKDLVERVRTDNGDRNAWLLRKTNFMQRRYGLLKRNPTWPWPDSSSIRMPLVDKTIDQLKPQYVSMAMQGNPPVSVLAHNEQSQTNADGVELLFEWLLNFGSPDWMRNLVLHVDDVLEIGFGVMKTGWEYRTRRIPEVLRRERLPQEFQQLVVAKDEKQAQQMQSVAQQFGLQQAILTKDEFESRREVVERGVQMQYGLSPDEPGDKVAIRKIVNWMADGSEGELEISSRSALIDAPFMRAVSPVDLIVPSNTTGIEEAERITEVHFLTEEQLRRGVLDAKFDKVAVQEILDRRGKAKGDRGGNKFRGATGVESTRAGYDVEQAAREGVRSLEGGSLIEVWEISTWRSKGLGKAMDRVVVTLAPGLIDMPLKSFVYSRKNWPYTQTNFELNKPRWYSARGIPEKLEDLDEEVTWQHRQRLNRMMIENAPTFAFRPSSMFNPQNHRWMPGSFIPSQNPQNDFVPIVAPPATPQSIQEEAILRTWAEEYIGGTDFGNQNSLSPSSEPRTATEIRGIQTASRVALSLRGRLFQGSLEKVYNEFFELWHLYGPQEVQVRVTGGAAPITLTKRDVMGNFSFQVRGTIGEMDPQVQSGLKLSRLQVLAQIAQSGLLGPKYEINMGEAVKDWLQTDDLRLSRKILIERTDEEAAQIAQQQADQEDQEAAEEIAMGRAPVRPGGKGTNGKSSTNRPAQR